VNTKVFYTKITIYYTLLYRIAPRTVPLSFFASVLSKAYTGNVNKHVIIKITVNQSNTVDCSSR